MKRIICIIPARGGSKGIPHKNLIPFCGKPLLAWSIEQVLASRHVKSVYVSSDDEEILKVARSYGAVGVKRPEELSMDSSTSEGALLHALDYIEGESGQKSDVVVFLQPTSPLRETNDIDNAIEKFLTERADSLFSAAALEDFCIWGSRDDRLKSITFDYEKRGFREDREPVYLENGSIYVLTPEILRKYNNRLGGKISIYFMEYWKSFEIDKIEDVEICEYFMRKKLLGNTKIDLKDIDLIIYDFDGIMTDDRVITFEDGKEAVTANRGDGLAVSILRRMSIPQLILSTETNKVVEARARKIGIPALTSVSDKKDALIRYCKEKGYNLKKVVYLGNDVNDLEAMKIAGYPVAPADAVDEVKNSAAIVLKTKGGNGVIKEFVNDRVHF